jgi:hypothetical protein
MGQNGSFWLIYFLIRALITRDLQFLPFGKVYASTWLVEANQRKDKKL